MRARFALFLICAFAVSSSALAQDLENENDGHFIGKLMLGFGGEAEIEADDLGGADGQDDMEMTYGLGFAYMHPLHEHFALGGQLAFLSWTTEFLEDIDADRSVMLDLSVVPQGKYAVRNNIELYASLPLGLTFDFFGEDDWFGAEVGGGVGFNLALMLGVRVAIDDSWGLLGELGYAYHAFSHTLEVPVTSTEIDLDISMGQFGINLGGWFSL